MSQISKIVICQTLWFTCLSCVKTSPQPIGQQIMLVDAEDSPTVDITVEDSAVEDSKMMDELSSINVDPLDSGKISTPNALSEVTNDSSPTIDASNMFDITENEAEVKDVEMDIQETSEVTEIQEIEITLEEPCTPVCTNKFCGNDGCGGFCGVCQESYACNCLDNQSHICTVGT